MINVPRFASSHDGNILHKEAHCSMGTSVDRPVRDNHSYLQNENDSNLSHRQVSASNGFHMTDSHPMSRNNSESLMRSARAGYTQSGSHVDDHRWNDWYMHTTANPVTNYTTRLYLPPTHARRASIGQSIDDPQPPRRSLDEHMYEEGQNDEQSVGGQVINVASKSQIQPTTSRCLPRDQPMSNIHASPINLPKAPNINQHSSSLPPVNPARRLAIEINSQGRDTQQRDIIRDARPSSDIPPTSHHEIVKELSELRILLANQHDETKQVVAAFREDIEKAVTTLVTSLSTTASISSAKRKKGTGTDTDKKAMAMH